MNRRSLLKLFGLGIPSLAIFRKLPWRSAASQPTGGSFTITGNSGDFALLAGQEIPAGRMIYVGADGLAYAMGPPPVDILAPCRKAFMDGARFTPANVCRLTELS
jgi:hypothetical protein